MANHVYKASRLDSVLEPPDGDEFDPYRDTIYSELTCNSFEKALDFAAADFHECGRVEEIVRTKHITNVVAAWEVYPDKTTRVIEP